MKTIIKNRIDHWQKMIVFLAFPTTAYADAGLPMLAVVWPLSLLAFIPVVLVEAWVVRRELSITWSLSLKQVLKANLLSTIVGIPITWLALIVIEFSCFFTIKTLGLSNYYPPIGFGEAASIFLSAPWLGPFSKDSHWIIPLATIILLIPFFSHHTGLSHGTSARIFPLPTQKKGKQALWKANILSYSILISICAIWLAFNIFR